VKKRVILASIIVALLFFSVFHYVAIAWEFERPSCLVDINERDETSITNGNVSVGLGTHIGEYVDDSSTYGCDYALLKLVATSNTRRNVNYQWMGDTFLWHDITYNVSDHPWQGGWVSTFGNPFQFYGGYRSSEYYSVWVSPYGFVSVDGEYWGSPPSSIPSGIDPNAFIAVFWRDDLYIDDQSSITYGYVSHLFGVDCLCISWNNLWSPGGNGYRHSFQLLLEITSGYDRFYFYGRIWLQYRSIVVNNAVLVGVEDESGELGVTIDSTYLSSGSAFRIFPQRWGRFIKNLKITITKPEGDTTANIDIFTTGLGVSNFRGYNIAGNLTPPEHEDLSGRFATAFLGTGTLLATVFFPEVGWVKGLCLLIDGALCAYGWTDAFFAAQKQAQALPPLDIIDGQTVNHIKVAAVNEGVMDASVCIFAYWFFYDNNNQEHELYVTATVEYDDVDSQYGYTPYLRTLTTEPIHLKFTRDIGNDFANVKTVTPGFYRGCLGRETIQSPRDDDDFYKINVVWPNTQIDVSVTSPIEANFDLYLYDAGHNLRAMSCNPEEGATETIRYIGFGGNWYVDVKRAGGNGIYNLTIALSVPPPPPPPPPGGGCPTLFVWNGTVFLEEATLNIHSEPNVDVNFFYPLNNAPAIKYGVYTLKLSEIGEGYNFTESFIDNTKLFIIDEHGFWYPCPLLMATHSRYGNVWSKLVLSDDVRTNTLKGDEILLKFFNFWPVNPTAFVFILEGHNPLKQ
jgi:hypothetical protein